MKFLTESHKKSRNIPSKLFESKLLEFSIKSFAGDTRKDSRPGWKSGQRECSGQSNDQNRNRGLSDHPFGSTADQDIGDRAVAVGTHNDEITILFFGCFDYNFSRVSVFD